jgi:cardiolipin synthase A/B
LPAIGYRSAVSRLFGLLLATCVCGACTTSAQLHSAPEPISNAAAAQPVATTAGIVTEAKADALLANAAPERTLAEQARLEKLVAAVRRSLSSPLLAGNRAHVLVDGPATFAAINAAITQARHHIHIETYIFSDDALGRDFARLLIDKRREGVPVRVIYDAVGSIATPAKFFADLQAAGVEIVEFRPLNPVKTRLWRFHNRDHRKIIVVDGTMAFTGGLNISDAYSSGSASKPGPKAGLTQGWRDTHVQITGPAVRQFQHLFVETWQQLGGKIVSDTDYYPTPTNTGDHLISAVASNGQREQDEAIYRTYLAAVRNCSTRIWITQAYFSPPAELSGALIDAVRRGVDVRVIVPGFTDSKLVLYASRHEYQSLLERGIRIIEARQALLHAKTALVDNSLTIIGSANLDYRSFLHNNEVTAVIIGDDAGKAMEALFEKDLAAGRELTLTKWKQRSLTQRAKESLASLFKFWL